MVLNLGHILGIPRLSKAVSADLGRLKSVDPSVAKKAIAYVNSGGNETVLATLANLDVEKTLKLDTRYGRDAGDIARAHYFAREASDVALLARYAQVLAAALNQPPDYLVGSKNVPLDLRVFFSFAALGLIADANTWPRKPISASTCKLTPSHMLEICRAAGGDAVDVFDILFNLDGRWNRIDDLTLLPGIHDFTGLVRDEKAAFCAAGRRMNAGGKVALLQKLREWGLQDDPEIHDLVFDLVVDSAKSVREEALQVAMTLPAQTVEKFAKAKLETGPVATRVAMVDLLVGLKSETALELIKQHFPGEKAARVKSAIESALAVEAATQSESHGENDRPDRYTALDGSVVCIPAMPEVATEPKTVFGSEDVETLKQLIAKENAEIDRRNAARDRQHSFKEKKIPTKFAAQIVEGLNRGPDDPRQQKNNDHWRCFRYEGINAWSRGALKRMAPERVLRLAIVARDCLHASFHQNPYNAFAEYVIDYVNGPEGDYRVLEQLFATYGEMVWGPWSDRKTRPAKSGDVLRQELSREWRTYDVLDLNQDALWPLLAESLDIFDEAFGLRPTQSPAPDKHLAVQFMQLLPGTPQRYYGPLLEIATGTTKTSRAEARALLAGAPGLEDRVIDLLEDGRQDARAGAATWLADLGVTKARKALESRLKKEKSDLARAAILTALSRMGEDLAAYVGPDALIAEAEKTLAKAKLDKLDWLLASHPPVLEFRNGDLVPDTVIKAWLSVAMKLKQPGGNTLFDIYLDQLDPKSAKAFSTWIFDAWTTFDTVRPDAAASNAFAEQRAEQTYKATVRWMSDYTREQAFQQLYRDHASQYLNSGTATKGILGLAKHVEPTHSAAVVRTYLKQHGSRTSQASSLLELLAAKGDPLSLQVVISAATRLKQKGVQAHAGKLVEAVAEAHEWSMDELADRTIPTAGLGDNAVLDLPCGPEEKPYIARLDDDLKLIVFNPAGKPIKALPAGDDEATKSSKKQLSASKRELKQVISLQAERLYEALCAERCWALADWQRDFRDHPLMGRLTERVVWLGMGAEGAKPAAFRPTAEGDYVGSDDSAVDLAAFSHVRLAHGALLPADEGARWADHFSDYEVAPLFAQFGRALLKPAADQADHTQIEDRMGWISDTFSFRGAASKLGYERGEALDGGYFNEYTKSFRSAGLVAVIEFSGNCLPEENVAAAQGHLSFVRLHARDRRGRAVPLSKVPPVLLSECWNDYRDMVAKGSFDPDWRKKMPWI